MRNKYIIITFRTAIVLSAFYGIYLNSGLPETFHPTMFLYYTILNNLICLMYFVFVLVKNVRNFKTWNINNQNENVILPKLKGSITLSITVTFLVFHFLLAPLIPANDPLYSTAGASWFVHYLVPILVILDWIFFDIKGRYNTYDPFVWLVIPYGYLLLAFVYGAFGPAFRKLSSSDGFSKYAYWFIDVDVLGWQQIIINVISLTIVFIVIGYIIYGVDKFIASRKKLK